MLQNLIENFSIQNLNAFLRNKINSYNGDNENLDYLFNETIFDKYENIEKQGEAKLGNDEIIVITAKTHEPLTDRTGKRNQYEIAKKIIKQEVKDGALFVFYDEQGHFRFSFVKVNYIGTKRKFTEFKRYTYFVSKEQTYKTFIQQIGSCNFKSIDEIINAFSVEPLNKQFYIAIQGIFNKLVSTNAVLELPSTPHTSNQKIYQEFAVRLIGRTIFCWFLKNKKSDAGVSLIPNEWLSSSAVRNTQGYYHSILEKLFFLALNTKMEDRQNFDLPKEHTQIPFLNGGLFEPHIYDFFSNNRPNYALKIPDAWFEELFKILEQYNFTIDERSMSDAEVSIDPEMLGTIFENLLAEIDPDTGQSARNATGSFYTPREIVDYMVEQSLVQYLKTKTDVENEEELLLLFKEGELKNEEHHFDTKTTDELLKALSEVTILDPACGSGAFPMGAVQKIVLALKNLDPTAEKWTEIQLKRFHGNSEIRKKLEQKLKTATSDYARKLGVIQNAIYGVDIQPIATDISKLRSFLSLVIDENIDDTTENRGIEPLPNLEFKFVTANTLISLPKQNKQQDIFTDYETVERLENLRDDYLQSSGRRKNEIKERFTNLQRRVFGEHHNLFADHESRAYKIMSWNPFSNESSEWFDPKWMFGVEKFDIVIGNPPYVQLQKNRGVLADLYQNRGYETFRRTGDIYCLFYENGINLLKENGNLCYITSNKWMRAGYGDVLRGFFARYNPIKLVDFAGFKVFESATVDTNILLLGKSKNQENTQAIHFKDDYKKGDDLTKYVTENAITNCFNDSDIWTILSPIEQRIKTKIERIGTPLRDWDINIYRGVLTGYNEAFIITGEQKDELIRQDPKSAEIIKPLIRGKNLKQYSYDFADKWLIYIPWHFPLHKDSTITGVSVKAEKLFQKQYPAVYNHLSSHKEGLSKRNKSETGVRYEWYALQRWGANYYEEFDKEKIAWASVGATEYSLIPKNFFLLDTNYFFTLTKETTFLIAILNSKLIINWINNEDTPIGQGGAFRHYKPTLEKLPIPKIKDNTTLTELAEQIIEQKANNQDTTTLEKEVDKLVYQLYELTDEEIEFIEEKTK